MSNYSELEFNFEPRDGGAVIRVYVCLASGGTYEEPELHQDGEPVLERLDCDPETPDRVIVRSAWTELTEPIRTFHPAAWGPNPAYRAQPIGMGELCLEDRGRLEAEIDRRIEAVLQDHWSDIAQDIAESAADALYDAWKDGDL